MNETDDRMRWAREVDAILKADPRKGDPKRWVITKDVRRCIDYGCKGYHDASARPRVTNDVTGDGESLCKECNRTGRWQLREFKQVIPCRSCGDPKDTTVKVYVSPTLGGDGKKVYFAERCQICETQVSARHHLNEYERLSKKARAMRAARNESKLARGASREG